MSDSGEKKHPASAKKLRDQRKKGQVAQSQDVGKLLVLTALSEIALFTADTSMQRFQQMIALPLARIGQPFARALEEVLTEALVLFFSFGLLMVGVAIGVKLISSWMQFGLLFAPESLKLDFNRLNPLTQLKQMFSAQSLMNLLMGIGKSLLLGLILYVVIGPSLGALINLANSDLQSYIPRADHTLPALVACVSGGAAGAGAY
jgi:type III secretion protein U